ncbi:MAG TPA: DUF1549 and DUF1553 domain-containing protein [Planctomycetaceae bacterium]|nr:DUF1549 and DUF1553 domain-containing protein [Planctomycetaceae bacterium]
MRRSTALAAAIVIVTAGAGRTAPAAISSAQHPPVKPPSVKHPAQPSVIQISPSTRALSISPARVELSGNFARAQLVVSAADASGKVTPHSDDLTSRAKYESNAPGVVRVGRDGALTVAGNGQAVIRVVVDAPHGELTATVPVTVRDVVSHPQVGYAREIAPIFSKAGCNMGACHAAQYGQAGFKLSVFGYEPSADHASIVRDRSERRVNFLEPEQSLLLKKPTLQVPHGGGRRMKIGSTEYATLAAWIASGAPGPAANDPTVTKIIVTPSRRITVPHAQQQLRVEAIYSDGVRRDVTALSKFDSVDEGVLSVTPQGLFTTNGQGQASALVRFEGQAAISTFVLPYAANSQLADWTNQNFIDELASAKFRELGIEPSGLCSDSAFLRRAFLDAIGEIPTIEETRSFLASKDPAKRQHLVDRLLGLTGDSKLDTYNDAYAAWWTLKWSDLIRNQSNDLGEQGMWAFHNWLSESFRSNKPFDRFVRELVTAKGSIYTVGPANFYRINSNPADCAEATAQLFLGVRLQCARCHHHPFEKYGQEDYFSFAAYFARVGAKPSQEFGLFGRESVVIVRRSGEVVNPRTGAILKPKPLDGSPADDPSDRRNVLANWLTSPANAFFAKSVVNRYVSYLMGHGLVDPVDDLRATNPPSNPEMMDALAKHFVASGFDLKQLLRVIMTSRLYQLDSQPSPANASDRKFFSHFNVKRLSAEALLDAVDEATGTRTKFTSLPLGTRAVELPDAEYQNYFLKTFGKPVRASVCECERSTDESLAQALHTLNGDIVTDKIADSKARVARLLAAKTPGDRIVEELYLATLCRYPTPAERDNAGQFVKESQSRTECYQDLQWALINSKEFLFVH